MKQNIFIGIIIFLSVVAQASFLPNFFSSGVIPDIVLIIIIILTAKSDFNSVLIGVIFAGLMMDWLSFYPVGVNVLSFVVMVFVINSLSKRFLVSRSARGFFVTMVAIVIGTLINYIIIFLLVKIFIHLKELSENGLGDPRLFFNKNLFLKPLYNMIMFIIIYWPLKRLIKIFAYQDKRIMIKR